MRRCKPTRQKLLLLAAESGDAAAQFNLAVLCDSRPDDNGNPIGRDPPPPSQSA
jgi:hypothetical protein